MLRYFGWWMLVGSSLLSCGVSEEPIGSSAHLEEVPAEAMVNPRPSTPGAVRRRSEACNSQVTWKASIRTTALRTAVRACINDICCNHEIEVLDDKCDVTSFEDVQPPACPACAERTAPESVQVTVRIELTDSEDMLGDGDIATLVVNDVGAESELARVERELTYETRVDGDYRCMSASVDYQQ